MFRHLLAGYATPKDRYDELLTAAGVPRAHWDAFLRSMAAREGLEISETLVLMEREIRENGVTYNVYADPQGADRLWEVDPLPLLLSAAEWSEIEAGIAQRADLLNRVLTDIYGPQELLRSGEIPPAVVFGHSGYLHQVQGIRPPGGVHLFHYAADLARSPDGHWWVVNDRTQAPSGAGYALENRLVVSRVFPDMFRDLHVQHLASFFSAFRDSLMRWAPRDTSPPLVVVLTPGPYNETYFEHALLARYLGFALVEGTDLTVRDGCVWMKTVEGLRRVHAVVRRQDDNFCDPLELRSDSALGVPGLTDCARRGTVMLANALGSGVVESGGLMGYLPALSERLLGEPLKLPSVATWWLGEPAAFDDAWERLDQVLIKPLERSVNEPAVFGVDLTPAQRAAFKLKVAARPQRYVAQEWVHVSQAPVLEKAGLIQTQTQSQQGSSQSQTLTSKKSERLGSRTVGLRVFAVATPSGYRVMPGGLARVAGQGDSRVIAMQRGGRSKDTWVLSDAPVNVGFSLLGRTVQPEDLVTSRSNLSSRSAENLFWFGRYGERCDAAARLLRVALAGVQGLGAVRGDNLSPALVLARRLGLLTPASAVADITDSGDTTDAVEAQLLTCATDPAGALSDRLKQLARVAYSLRDRMSADNWRTLNQLSGDEVFQASSADAALVPVSMPVAMAWLDRAVIAMTTLSGFALDGMTRGSGWRFLSMGRRIERLLSVIAALQVALGEIREGRALELDWLLELNDSTITYRSRYMAGPEWLPVLDLLIRDDANPRSVAFQVKGLMDYITKLEATHGRFASDVLAPAYTALRQLTPADLQPESTVLASVLDQLQRAANAVSEELNLKFFSHAASRSVLSLVA
jgi:uncharacterized circularly permuted ATP-grasp superfamily protein/uncharacterized alpha-E superfamily protein